jgi:APA family basic amino acid/polyamine antiporter
MTGILIIVADMIGTGIFMTTGNILGMTQDALLVLVLWSIGGLVAIAGSLCYAELAAIWPRAGGEYVYLKNTFGLLPAFLTGWVSLSVGFSAPIAASSLLLIQYIDRFLHTLPGNNHLSALFEPLWVRKISAASLIVFFGTMHIIGVKKGSALQNTLTVTKILLVALLIAFGLSAADWSMADRLSARYVPLSGAPESGLPQTGLALLIIMFAYSGWSCTSYLAGEIKDPARTLPRALMLGTLITTVLYLLLNVVYLISADGQDLMGKDEVGAIAASHLFGARSNGVFTLGIAVVLLSAVSAQMMAGPRVYFAMAEDRMIFRALARVHPRYETPYVSILVQTFLAVLYVFTGSALKLVIYMGFALNIFPVLAVIGLMHLHHTRPDIKRPFRVPFYPVTPLIFISLTIAMMAAALFNWTETSFFAIAVVLLGIPVFYLWKQTIDKRQMKVQRSENKK